MGDESSAVAQPQQADAHSLEEAQQRRPLLVVLGCIYRERKNELRQGIASFTKLPPTFNNTHDTFILVCADGALSQQGGASVQAVARKYMRLIGETWKGRDEAQRAFWEDDSRVQVTWFGAVKCGTLPLPALLSRTAPTSLRRYAHRIVSVVRSRSTPAQGSESSAKSHIAP